MVNSIQTPGLSLLNSEVGSIPSTIYDDDQPCYSNKVKTPGRGGDEVRAVYRLKFPGFHRQLCRMNSVGLKGGSGTRT